MNPYSQPDPGIAQQERDLERISKAGETVYAHVERTVHALLDGIASSLQSNDSGARIEKLAAAVRDLSAWPQFNPRDAHEQYQKLAEFEVERAVKAKLANLRDVADELEKRLHAAVNR